MPVMLPDRAKIRVCPPTVRFLAMARTTEPPEVAAERLTGRAVTRPHQHVSLFDETDAALAKLPRATFRFVGERLRYPPAIGPPPQTAPLCEGALWKTAQ